MKMFSEIQQDFCDLKTNLFRTSMCGINSRSQLIDRFGQILALLIFYVVSSIAASAEEKQFFVDLKDSVKEIRKLKDDKNFALKDDIPALRRQLELQIDQVSSSVAALQLAKLGDINFLELNWWRSKDQKVRICCLVGLLLQPVDDIQLQSTRKRLVEGSGRFKEEETKIRNLEITYIYKNRDFLAKVVWGK